MTARDIMVIKCGGHASVDPAAVCADVAWLRAAGTAVVCVHGGSAEIERLAAGLSVPLRRLASPDGMSARYTDAATLDVVSLALGGRVQPRLVMALLRAGVPAVGLSGVDGGLLRGRRRAAQRVLAGAGRQAIVRDDHSGRVTTVNTALLTALSAAGFVPVISPPVLGEDGTMLNADSDRVAAAVAGAIGASTLLMLTGAAGVLADPADPASVLAECAVPPEGPPPLRGGGIGVKLLAARDALAAGVPAVLIADGRAGQPVRRALAGEATKVTMAALTSAAQR